MRKQDVNNRRPVIFLSPPCEKKQREVRGCATLSKAILIQASVTLVLVYFCVCGTWRCQSSDHTYMCLRSSCLQILLCLLFLLVVLDRTPNYHSLSIFSLHQLELDAEIHICTKKEHSWSGLDQLDHWSNKYQRSALLKEAP